MNMILILEILGTIAFAISGAMVAINKKMDILGVVILGTTTAVGGGIIRDIIIGVTPPVAFQEPLYALIAIGVSIIVFLPFVRKRINLDNFVFIIIDALGLGVFTVVGVISGMSFNNLFLQVFLGTITGVGGGVMRDLFANEQPMIFVRHFYACACIIGALICALLYPYYKELSMVLGIVVVLVLRILAAKFKWNLPKAE